MTLLDRIRGEIQASGPMPFERFMGLALYDPDGGFFGSGPLRSTKSGDFLTSPEVSPWFGRTLANAIGEPGTVVEVGAGSGSLLRPLVDALPAPPERVVAVDASPASQTALGDLGFETARDLADLEEPFAGAIIANELLDNLPMRIAARAGDSWVERWIGAEDAGLGFVEAPAREDTVAWLDAYAGNVPDGGVVEVQLEAARWLRRAIDLLTTGVIIVVDYGATAEELEPRRAIGTLRTYRAHHLGPDPLLEPGATDITADVNFTALLDVAHGAGAEAKLHRQDDFLADHGLRDEMARMRILELELARTDDAMARLKVRSELKDAETLLHPRGLGDFRVLLVTVG
ncbi:MAG: hypothetical protein HKN91_18110 [Acidimicrobiia bacterium]|nr:hypothetical protein [Acidimicrobiia bacterium]